MANVNIRFADVKIWANTNQIHLFLKSNRSIDHVRKMKPDLYKSLIDRTADFCQARNSLVAIIHHLFGVHLEKGFQGEGLAWAKRPLPSNTLGYTTLDAIAHFDAYFSLSEFHSLFQEIKTLTSKERIMTSRGAVKKEQLPLANSTSPYAKLNKEPVPRNSTSKSSTEDKEEREKSEEETEISGDDLFVSLESEERKEKVLYTERQLPTSSSDLTKKNWEEKTSTKSLKPQPKKPK
uniref:Uncharacterized protein n=1 Tax=Romanomermis culicivorax TaxID=13658 RepID=A0A915K5V9_ROMCU